MCQSSNKQHQIHAVMALENIGGAETCLIHSPKVYKSQPSPLGLFMVHGITFQRNCRQPQACSWATSSSITLLKTLKTTFPYWDEGFTRIEKFKSAPMK